MDQSVPREPARGSSKSLRGREVGGYLEAQDLVFVLDVNDHFRPWLVERPRLFAAIDTLDGEKKRGLLRIE